MYEAQKASEDYADAQRKAAEAGETLSENSDEAKALERAYSRLGNVMEDTFDNASSRYFRDTAQSMQDLAKGTGK